MLKLLKLFIVRDFHISDHKSQIIKFTDDSKKVNPLSKTILNKNWKQNKFSSSLACKDWSELSNELNLSKAVDILYNVINYYHALSFP